MAGIAATDEQARSSDLGRGGVRNFQQGCEMIADFGGADLTHAPIRLITTSPLHTGMQGTTSINEISQSAVRTESVGASRTEEDGSRLTETIGNVSGASVVRNDCARMGDQANQIQHTEIIQARAHIRP
jgi:hypothetical protein